MKEVQILGKINFVVQIIASKIKKSYTQIKNKLTKNRDENSIELPSLGTQNTTPPLKILQNCSSFFCANFRHLPIIIIGIFAICANYFVKDNSVVMEVQDFQQDQGSIIEEEPQEEINQTAQNLSRYISGNDNLAKIEIESPHIAKFATSETSGSNFLIKPQIMGVEVAQAETSSQQENGEISVSRPSTHVVQKGETLSQIGKKYSLSEQTLKVANGIENADLIKPGQRLTIPPGNGILHTVSKGEALIGIVKYYQGNLAETVRLNNITSTDKIYAGQKILVVSGKIPAPKPQPRVQLARNSKTYKSSRVLSYSKGPNRFPWGYCTWYVASKRYIPWRGNARAWPANARAMGYTVSRQPKVGAIMATNESAWGHVAYVEAVSGNSVTISEMNYAGFGRISRRTLSAHYGIYIY